MSRRPCCLARSPCKPPWLCHASAAESRASAIRAPTYWTRTSQPFCEALHRTRVMPASPRLAQPERLRDMIEALNLEIMPAHHLRLLLGQLHDGLSNQPEQLRPRDRFFRAIRGRNLNLVAIFT